ncbi:MAG: hypothetical protein WDO68_10990 [Gammaproteobacteria bacterium]
MASCPAACLYVFAQADWTAEIRVPELLACIGIETWKEAFAGG